MDFVHKKSINCIKYILIILIKSLIIMTIIALATMSVLSGCEKPDYQHPGNRSGKVK